jgi:hypothetical protein
MSVQYPVAFVQQFSNNLIHLAQQKGSRLMRSVKQERVNAKSHHFDRLGSTVAQLKTSRHGDTPLIDTPHSRRRVTMNDYEWADLVDTNDKIRALIDPTSDYAMAGGWAMGRAIDDAILAAMIGNSIAVDSSDSASNVVFDTGMIVDEDFGTTDSNMTAAKVMEARRKLRAQDIDMDEEMFLVLNSSAISALMQDSDVKDFDINTSKPMANGELPFWAGFNIIHTERLSGTADATGNDPIICLAYAKSAMGLAIGQDINVRMSERADKSYSTQVFASATFGAVRVEEEKIVQIHCAQAA